MVEVLERELGAALEAPVDVPGGSAGEDAVAFASVHRPESGETLVVPTAAGLLLVVEFNPADAGFAVEGDDFVLTLEGTAPRSCSRAWSRPPRARTHPRFRSPASTSGPMS